MSYCEKCGAKVPEDAKFCPVCGAPIKKEPVSPAQQEQQEQAAPVPDASSYAALFKVLFVVLFVIIVLVIQSNVRTSRAVNAAEKYVKSQVYESYGCIPALDSDILYKKNHRAIVVVRFRCTDPDFDGSYAVAVSTMNGYVANATTEQPFDMDYSAHLEELKVIFEID